MLKTYEAEIIRTFEECDNDLKKTIENLGGKYSDSLVRHILGSKNDYGKTTQKKLID